MARIKMASRFGDKPHPVRDLGDELFLAVQAAQGHGFISDGISDIADRDQFFGIVRNHLHHTVLAARIIRKFLKKYNEE